MPSVPAAEPPVVAVRGHAEVEVPPDRADFALTVTATASSADRVRRDLATRVTALAEQVRGLGAGVERSLTGSVSVSPVYDRRGADVRGYRGTVAVDVVVVDFGIFDALLRVATVQPGCTIAGPGWSLRADHPAHRDARLAAVADARARAADYAEAFGCRLGALVEVSDLREPGFAGPMKVRAAAAFAGEPSEPELELDPVPQSVFAEVTVRFALEQPSD